MIDLIFYNYETQQWERTTDTQMIKLNECLQELSLYRGESWFYGNYGADYEGLFRGEVDITAQILTIIDKYQQYFLSIDTISSRTSEALLFSIIFYFDNGESAQYNVGYTHSKQRTSRFDVKITKRS